MRLLPWVISAASLAAAVALWANREPPPPRVAPPLTLAPAGEAIEALLEALDALGVPREQVEVGHYPLIAPQGAAQGADAGGRWPAVLPLLSAPCPLSLEGPRALERLTPALLRAGYQLSASEVPWRSGRPFFVGVSRGGLPSLALRLMPSSSRLTVLMAPPPPVEVPPRDLRRLPDDVSFAVDLNAPGGLATYDYLANAHREVILHTPSAAWEERGAAPPPAVARALPTEGPPQATQGELTLRWEPELRALSARAHLSALALPASALSYQTPPHLEALMARLVEERVTLVEPLEGGTQLAFALARAGGVRVLRPTHAVETTSPERLEVSLKAVEAALVLSGAAVLWVPPLKREDWKRVALWLTHLTAERGVSLLRVSEVAL
jgi:hypothetical protein